MPVKSGIARRLGTGIRYTRVARQKRTRVVHTPVDPVQSAQAARLRYTADNTRGIRRKRAGKRFRYLGINGKVIRDPAQLRRIQALVIPPAWRDVWISPIPEGHLQAT